MTLRFAPLIALALATSSLASCGSSGGNEEPPLSEEALAALVHRDSMIGVTEVTA